LSLTKTQIVVPTERYEAEERRLVVELYDGLRPALNAYLCKRGLTRDCSEDIIQETFLRLMRHKLAPAFDDNLRSWIFRVAHNLSMDFHRSERRRTRSSVAEALRAGRIHHAPNPEQLVILTERWNQFRRAVAQLTPKQRHCLMLRAAGMRYSEISSVLGVSTQRVGELMQRIISRVEPQSKME
jgi:RNA polymerase sigma-70 factor, ECF subfamily